MYHPLPPSTAFYRPLPLPSGAGLGWAGVPPHFSPMRVTTWAEYGLIVSLNLAKRAGQGPVAARELAEQERLPHGNVEPTLLRLRRARPVGCVPRAEGGDRL